MTEFETERPESLRELKENAGFIGRIRLSIANVLVGLTIKVMPVVEIGENDDE